jgi:hypothetical protein
VEIGSPNIKDKKLKRFDTAREIIEELKLDDEEEESNSFIEKQRYQRQKTSKIKHSKFKMPTISEDKQKPVLKAA